MEENRLKKKALVIPAQAKLPYAAAALGGLMVLLCFFGRSLSDGSIVLRFPLELRGFAYFRTLFIPFVDFLMLLSGASLLLVGAFLGKRSRYALLLPAALYLTAHVALVIFSRNISHYLYYENSTVYQFVVALLVGAAVALTVTGVLKTKIPLIVVSLAALAYTVFRFVAGTGDGIYFLGSYGISAWPVSDWPDVMQFLKAVCLYLGIGLLALSMNCREVPAPAVSQFTAAPENGGVQGLSARPGEQAPSCLLERRSIGVCILLSLVTFGIYYVYWRYTLCKKLRAWAGENESCGGETACLVLVPFYSLYWMFTRGKKFYAVSSARGVYVQDNAVVYLILDLFGLGIVSYALIQNDFNRIAEGLAGAPPAAYAQPVPPPSTQASPTAAPPAPAGKPDAEARLGQIRSLLDKGIISQEEYEAKRQEILRDL